MSNKVKISNWGNYPSVEAQVLETADHTELENHLKNNPSIIARGNGRSYGDASLNEVVYSTKQLNKIHSLNKENGIIDCESGVSLAAILEQIVPNGYFLEVTPGTKFITVGGAIAADVHGKNHHHIGCFSQSLISFSLMNENGVILTCSRKENVNLFNETVGGMGLTGVILRAQIKLQPIATSYISYLNSTAIDLEGLMHLFQQYKAMPYSVAWIDCLAKGESKGRGVFMSGAHAETNELPVKLKNNPLVYNPKTKLKIGFNFPSFVLSSMSIKLFNRYIFGKNKRAKKEGVSTIESFFYPLDSIQNWNKIYGKKGFIQYQCVLPLANSKEGLNKIIDVVSSHSTPPFLTVLKLFGKSNEASPWSFPMEGYTLAMDFKMHEGIEKLVESLDNIVKEYGGRVYLAKDALSSKKVLEIPSSKTNKFSSIQSKRIS